MSEPLDLDALKETVGLIVTDLWFQGPQGWCIPPSDEPRVRAVLAALPALIAAAEERDRLRSQVNELEELVLLQHNTYGSRDRILAEIEKMAEEESEPDKDLAPAARTLAEAHRRAGIE